jgi:hypothetical protein
MRLVLEVEASKHAYGVEPSSLGGLGPGATNKGTMLLPSVIAVYSTRDQMLRKRHKGHKQKGYVELLLSVSTGVCPKYSLRTRKGSRFGQRHGLQSITLTPCFHKNIYQKVIYVYFYESIFQDKSIHIAFTFSYSTT